jgi:HAD superfamily hydrolase (TIGR01450 family)
MLSSADDAGALIGTHGTFLLDCDGVLFKGAEPIPGASETVAALRAAGKHVRFVTNNSTKTREDVLAKLHAAGLAGASIDEVCSSASVTARWLARELPAGAKVFVVGHAGLMHEIERAGLTPLGGAEYERPDYGCGPFEVDREVRAVVVAFDRRATYFKLAYAMRCATVAGARFVATNTDPQFPCEDGFIPGGGCNVAFVATAVGAQPTVIGKPEQLMMDVIKVGAGPLLLFIFLIVFF